MFCTRPALIIVGVVGLFCWTLSCAEPEVRVSGPLIRAVVSESNTAPYAYFSVDGKLSGGIRKQAMSALPRLNHGSTLALGKSKYST